MNQLSHRDRVLLAINNKPVDRIPFDFGSHPNASIHVEAYEKLKAYLGIQSHTRVMHRWMQVAEVDEAILCLFNIDTRRLSLGSRDNQLERDLDNTTYVDQWGVVRRKPAGALYYELVHCPLAGEISIHDIVNYPWPDPNDPGITRDLRYRAASLKNISDYAIVLTLPSAFLHTSQFIRGFEDWYLDCATRPVLLETLFDAVLEVNLETVRGVLRDVGDMVDIVVTADDIGDQRGIITSPVMYRRLIKFRQKKYFDEIHRLTSAKLVYHTCGSVIEVLEDLIEIGVDVLNPVQTSAKGMDPQTLKRKAGAHLAFWGGVDTQRLLCQGSCADISREKETLIRILGEGGGFVLAPAHNIQPDVPPENICELFMRR